MQEVLNELFYGNVHPNEKQFIRDSEYGKAIKIVSDCEDRLMTLISGKELELFEALMKAQGDSSHINGREKFVEGVPQSHADVAWERELLWKLWRRMTVA